MVAGAALVIGGMLVLGIVLTPWQQVGLALAATEPALLALALAASLAVYPLWVWQWRCLAAPLRRVRWPVMAQVVALSIGARFAVSGLGGVATGAAALHAHAGLTPAEATGVMTLDQVLAGAAKLAVLALALALAPLPESLRHATLALTAGMLGLGLLLFALRRFGQLWTARIGGVIARYASDVGQLLRRGVLVPGTILALAKKALEVAAALALQHALGIQASPALALLAVASISLVSLLPLAPVHLGPQALAVVSTYAALGTPPAQAIAIGVLHQGLMLVTVLIVGVVALGLGAMPSGPKSAS